MHGHCIRSMFAWYQAVLAVAASFHVKIVDPLRRASSVCYQHFWP